jgi:hypothetical protein
MHYATIGGFHKIPSFDQVPKWLTTVSGKYAKRLMTSSAREGRETPGATCLWSLKRNVVLTYPTVRVLKGFALNYIITHCLRGTAIALAY